jgi:hypothetical protein
LCLAPPLVACKLLLVFDELAFCKLVNSITKFNGAYGGVVLTVPPRNIVSDEAEGLAIHVLAVLRCFIGRGLQSKEDILALG